MKTKIVFNEITIGYLPYIHDHMIDAIQDDNVECERYTGITPLTQWLAYTMEDSKVKVEKDCDDWTVKIRTKHYEIEFSVPVDQIYNISIF